MTRNDALGSSLSASETGSTSYWVVRRSRTSKMEGTLARKEAIEAAIRQCDGNIPKAAALLEISPSTIYRKKQAWEETAVGGRTGL